MVLADITRSLPVRSGQFDHAVMLAVPEHLREPESVLREAHRVLVPSSSLIMTRPTAAADPVLHLPHGIGLASKENESEKHKQGIPFPTLDAMRSEIRFERFRHRTFELGLNNLLVARKQGDDFADFVLRVEGSVRTRTICMSSAIFLQAKRSSLVCRREKIDCSAGGQLTIIGHGRIAERMARHTMVRAPSWPSLR